MVTNMGRIHLDSSFQSDLTNYPTIKELGGILTQNDYVEIEIPIFYIPLSGLNAWLPCSTGKYLRIDYIDLHYAANQYKRYSTSKNEISYAKKGPMWHIYLIVSDNSLGLSVGNTYFGKIRYKLDPI